MLRRHPHVFAGAAVEDAEAQTRAWDEHKRLEREADGHADTSALAGIARGLPEWQRAVKLQHKAAKIGFDWPGPEPVIAKLHEEIEEVRVEFAAVAADPGDDLARAQLEDEIGDLLFVCANIARHAMVDVGSALRRANHKFERRFRAMETLATADGVVLSTLSLEAQDRYWDRAKAAEIKPGR
jgi:ATP diphosphatase